MTIWQSVEKKHTHTQKQQQWKHKVDTLKVAHAKTHDQILVTLNFKSNLSLIIFSFNEIPSHFKELIPCFI
jgi:hypothetical protein